MSALTDFRLNLHRHEHRFADTLAFIDQHYDYRPTAFSNGDVQNAAGHNQGSCKVLGLALLESLSQEEALLCFSEHYRQVLSNPDGEDHANIRALMATGLGGVHFDSQPLSRKG